MCKLMEEAMSRNDEMTERRLFDRRAADIVAKAKDGEIVTLTAECVVLAEKVGTLRDALVAVCDAALPVTNVAYNVGQSHEQWGTSIKPSIERLDKARRDAHSVMRAAAAAPVAQPSAQTTVPEGFKLMPRKPTAEHVSEAVYNINRKTNVNRVDSALVREIYEMMIYALPAAPSQEPSAQVRDADQRGQSIDSPDFRKVTFAYLQAFKSGTVPETHQAYAEFVAYIEAWAAAQLPAQGTVTDAARGVLAASSPEEVAAFEAWAISEKYEMTTHPMHWLFLNERTYAARQGWKAALRFALAAPAQQPTDSAAQSGDKGVA